MPRSLHGFQVVTKSSRQTSMHSFNVHRWVASYISTCKYITLFVRVFPTDWVACFAFGGRKKLLFQRFLRRITKHNDRHGNLTNFTSVVNVPATIVCNVAIDALTRLADTDCLLAHFFSLFQQLAAILDRKALPETIVMTVFGKWWT